MSLDNNNMNIVINILKESKFLNFKLKKYNDNMSETVIYFDINNNSIKLTTDFLKYCLLESVDIKNNLINFNSFNLTMIIKNKSPEIILEELYKIINYKPIVNIFSDPFHIYQKIEEFTKIVINYSELEKIFYILNKNKKNTIIYNKIPKELLLSQLQINQLIINEIKKINRTHDYLHYIIPDIKNPYCLIVRFRFNNNKILEEINKKYGYDYIEINIIIDSEMHPIIPPKIEYIKPKIKLPLRLAITNLDILKLKNWNPSITLEYLIINLGIQLEKYINEYIIIDNIKNSNQQNILLENELFTLANITKYNIDNNISINIDIPIISINSNEKKYWNSGTGYGYDGINKWDISTYIKEQEHQNNELFNCLKNINSYIDTCDFSIILESNLINYIISQVKELNILELNKYQLVYTEIFNILNSLIGKIDNQTIINNISIGLKNIFDEINIFLNTIDAPTNEMFLHIYCCADWYISKYVENIKELIVCSDIKEEYCQIMKKLQFNTYEIPKDHRFIKDKDTKLEQKTIMRILSEISSFKNGLPLNWDSTIWVRIHKTNINMFSFLISGPKDTPYENGLFEFHAIFPSDYPNSVPHVLLHTTGNDTVRFNPNLYHTGKVCLSLLGTWAGEAGESWNPNTSTFLQVMVSIQSLIFVDEPYFNEPGYQKNMNTPQGKQFSNNYNEEKQPHTINLAMINMITNPPIGFEEIVHNHFKMKKDEIINKTLIWEQNAVNKKLIKENRDKLLKLL